MYRARVIPRLLIRGKGLVRTRRFKDPVFVGDPVNAMRIFSDSEVGEIVLIDIGGSRERCEPSYKLIPEMPGGAFIPDAYLGVIRHLDQTSRLIRCGIEKVAINTAATVSTDIVGYADTVFGGQSAVSSVDVRKAVFGGYRLVTKSAPVDTGPGLEEYIQNLIAAGVGEIYRNSVDGDGMVAGYDLPLIRSASQKVKVLVFACGGAGVFDAFRRQFVTVGRLLLLQEAGLCPMGSIARCL